MANLQQSKKGETITSMGALSPQPYKGTRDYYPAEKRVLNYIMSVWGGVSKRFGYEEYGAPLLEPLDIYAAKSGQELANEQTYTFTDRGGRTVAIRPEMTPSVSRLVAARRQELAYPARLYSIANFMRYERPQRGREREFWQLNLDIFGVDTIDAEAEIISIADLLLKAFGAKPDDYVIKINNRKLINYMMAQYLGLDAVDASFMIKLFDRRNKISEDDFWDQAREVLVEDTEERVGKIRTLLEAKSMADLPEEIRNSTVVAEVRELFTLLERSGVTSAVFDITLMRGLDYYTGTVFEVYDTHPDNNRSLFGGGRYDGLVGMFGAEPISAVGMAPGATTMENFLQVHGLLPDVRSTTDVYVIAIGDVRSRVARVAGVLRTRGINTELDITERKIDSQIKTPIKKNIPFVLFVGEEELEKGIYTLKDTVTKEEKKLTIDDIESLVKSRRR